MKKWNFLFMALLMSAAVLVTSCGGDDDDPIDKGPTINLKGGEGYTSKDDTVKVNESINVGVTGLKSSVSGSKLVNFKFSIVSNEIANTMLDTTFSSDNFEWETPIAFTGTGRARLLFELTDKNGKMNDKSFYVVVDDPGTAVTIYKDVEFGSWNDAAGSFFVSTEGVTYTVNQTATVPVNQEKVDFVYFYGQTNKNTMASPDDADANTIENLKLNLWTKKNQTRFNKTNLTVAQFDAIGNNYKFQTFNFGDQASKVNNLKVGDIFMFKTKSDKLGLVKITHLSKPTRGDTAKATIIVQK